MDVQLLSLFLTATHRELSERMVQVPRQELELQSLRMKVHVVVLSHRKNAVEIREPRRDSHEAREFFDIQVFVETCTELIVTCRRDELCEIDHTLLFSCRQRSLGVVGLLVLRPEDYAVGN